MKSKAFGYLLPIALVAVLISAGVVVLVHPTDKPQTASRCPSPA